MPAADDDLAPIVRGRNIRVPADVLWKAISTPGCLEACHPFCASVAVHAWPGPDSRDEIHYLNGRTFERRFHHWIDGRGYDLDIVAKSGRIAAVTWRIEAIAPGESSLSIAVAPRLPQRWPRWLGRLSQRLYVRPMLGRYLDSVLRGFEWYLTRGEPVPRNAFGRHPWFSEPRRAFARWQR